MSDSAPSSPRTKAVSTNKGAIIGGVVGGFAALVLSVFLLWFYLHWKQKQIRDKLHPYSSRNVLLFEKDGNTVSAQELDANNQPRELEADHITIPVELPVPR